MKKQKDNMKKSKNKEILNQMKEIYYKGMNIGDSKYLDWMGFEITYENKPSYHHIIKLQKQKSEGIAELTTIENGAYLGEYSHTALHQIERVDINLYNRWNNLFKEIVEQGTYPTIDLWEKVFDLQVESIELFDTVDCTKKRGK